MDEEVLHGGRRDAVSSSSVVRSDQRRSPAEEANTREGRALVTDGPSLDLDVLLALERVSELQTPYEEEGEGMKGHGQRSVQESREGEEAAASALADRARRLGATAVGESPVVWGRNDLPYPVGVTCWAVV